LRQGFWQQHCIGYFRILTVLQTPDQGSK